MSRYGQCKCKIQSQDMEVTRVESKVKIWKSQVQDHEMNESNGKGELCDTDMQFTSQSTLCGPSNLNTLLL